MDLKNLLRDVRTVTLRGTRYVFARLVAGSVVISFSCFLVVLLVEDVMERNA